MKLETRLRPEEVIDILRKEIDHLPSLLRCLFTLNAHRYRGTSVVCGKVRESEFELRNRRDPYLSLMAIGKVRGTTNGTEIDLRFEKPVLYSIFQIFHTDDREVIMMFLNENLHLENAPELLIQPGFESEGRYPK
jgi:hypothetical protein